MCKTPRRSRLLVELLEDRCTPATFTVLDTFASTDSPDGTAAPGLFVDIDNASDAGIDLDPRTTTPTQLADTRDVTLDYTGIAVPNTAGTSVTAEHPVAVCPSPPETTAGRIWSSTTVTCRCSMGFRSSCATPDTPSRRVHHRFLWGESLTRRRRFVPVIGGYHQLRAWNHDAGTCGTFSSRPSPPVTLLTRRPT